jgi:hypothetical protein
MSKLFLEREQRGEPLRIDDGGPFASGHFIGVISQCFREAKAEMDGRLPGVRRVKRKKLRIM